MNRLKSTLLVVGIFMLLIVPTVFAGDHVPDNPAGVLENAANTAVDLAGLATLTLGIVAVLKLAGIDPKKSAPIISTLAAVGVTVFPALGLNIAAYDAVFLSAGNALIAIAAFITQSGLSTLLYRISKSASIPVLGRPLSNTL